MLLEVALRGNRDGMTLEEIYQAAKENNACAPDVSLKEFLKLYDIPRLVAKDCLPNGTIVVTDGRYIRAAQIIELPDAPQKSKKQPTKPKADVKPVEEKLESKPEEPVKETKVEEPKVDAPEEPKTRGRGKSSPKE